MKANANLELLLNKHTSLLRKHIQLLKAIDETRSITKAAEKVGLSYKNAWDSLYEINNSSKKPLILSKKKSGTELSEYAKQLIKTYELVEKAQNDFLEKIFKINDITYEGILNLQRVELKLSARNKLLVEIVKIELGAINCIVTAKLSSGELLSSNITIKSQKDLELEVGQEILFIFKAPSVTLAKPNEKIPIKLSAENQIPTIVKEVRVGAVSAEIILETKGHQIITACVTKESVMKLKIGVGDELIAIIKASEIIIGL